MTDQAKAATSIGPDNLVPLGPRMRVDRASPLIAIQETLDEFNAWISVIITFASSKELREAMAIVQHDLRFLSDQIGLQSGPLLSHEHLARLDAAIAHLKPADFSADEDAVPPSTSTAAAFGSVARAICRRAERQISRLAELYGSVGVAGLKAPASDLALTYLRRLDLLLQIASFLESRRQSA